MKQLYRQQKSRICFLVIDALLVFLLTGFSAETEHHDILAQEALSKGFEKCEEAELLVEQNNSEAKWRMAQANGYFQSAARLVPALLSREHIQSQKKWCESIEKRIVSRSIQNHFLESLQYCEDAKIMLNEKKKVYSKFLQEKFLVSYRNISLENYENKDEFSLMVTDLKACKAWVDRSLREQNHQSRLVNSIATIESEWKQANEACIALKDQLSAHADKVSHDKKREQAEVIKKQQLQLKKTLYQLSPERVLDESFEASSLAEVGVLKHYMNAYECQRKLDEAIAKLENQTDSKPQEPVVVSVSLEQQFLIESEQVLRKYEESLISCERVDSMLQNTLFLDKILQKEKEMKAILAQSHTHLTLADQEKNSWDQRLVNQERELQELTFRRLYEMGQWHERAKTCLVDMRRSLKYIESKKDLFSKTL